MEYGSPRRCLPHNLSYPNYMYSDRNAPLSLAHNTRENPRGYPMGGPVGGMHNRASMEEPMMGNGPARRRIAVAVCQHVFQQFRNHSQRTQFLAALLATFSINAVPTFTNIVSSARVAVRGRFDAAAILEMVLGASTVERLE